MGMSDVRVCEFCHIKPATSGVRRHLCVDCWNRYVTSS